MKTLFLLRGLPGSGKTTTAQILSEGIYPVISADEYFEDKDMKYNFDPKKLPNAHAWCNIQVECLLAGSKIIYYPSNTSDLYESNEKIFVANTFTEEWEMEPYFELAKQYDYQVVTMIIENRHGSTNIHGVPDETIEKMKNRFNIKL